MKQAGNNEEDATNTENINTLHTATHRGEEAQARITSTTRQAKERITTLEGKQNDEYTDRREEGREIHRTTTQVKG